MFECGIKGKYVYGERYIESHWETEQREVERNTNKQMIQYEGVNRKKKESQN